jgi:hypothetical protein
MAIVVSLLTTLTMGVIEFSRMGMMCQLISTGAREGCRVAVVQYNTLSDVQGRVNQMLGSAGLTIASISPADSDPGTNGAFILPSNWDTVPGGTPITLVLRVPYSQVSWIPNPMFLKGAVLSGTAVLSSERP